MKTRIKHYRVPAGGNLGHKRRGEPGILYRYGRAVGWLEESSGTGGNEWKNIQPLARGGKTVCEIIDDSNKENKLMSTGVAVCSMSDNFNYKRGRDIAVGRAEAAMSDFDLLEEFTA